MQLDDWKVFSGLAVLFSSAVTVVTRWIHADMRREIADHKQKWNDFERARLHEIAGLTAKFEAFAKQLEDVKAATVRAATEDRERAMDVLRREVASDLQLARVTLEARIKEVDTERARGDDQLNTKHGQLRNDQKRMEREHDTDIKSLHGTFGRGKLYDHDDPRT